MKSGRCCCGSRKSCGWRWDPGSCGPTRPRWPRWRWCRRCWATGVANAAKAIVAWPSGCRLSEQPRPPNQVNGYRTVLFAAQRSVQRLRRQLSESLSVARCEFAEMPETVRKRTRLHTPACSAAAQLLAHRPEAQDPAIAMWAHAADGPCRTLESPDRHARLLRQFGRLVPDHQIAPNQFLHISDDPAIMLGGG